MEESVEVIRRVTAEEEKDGEKKRGVKMFGCLGHCPKENGISLSLCV